MLVAHQPTTELMRSLHLTRPISATLKRQNGEGRAFELPTPTLPAATAVQISAASTSSPTVNVESLDIRTTIPALLAGVREQGCTLTTMQAHPVTLTDVEMLQDLITAAFNDALKKAKDMMTQELGPLGQMMKQSGLGGL